MIKEELKRLYRLYSSREEILELADYYRVKRWVRKVCVLYGVFTVLAVLFALCVIGVRSALVSLAGGEGEGAAGVAMGILYLAVNLLSGWGLASLLLYFRQIVRSVGKTVGIGYEMGEQIQETHYQVTHEFGDRYHVTAHTENKGCLFGVIAGVCRFVLWAIFCVYVAPFLTFQKLRAELSVLKQYRESHGLRD